MNEKGRMREKESDFACFVPRDGLVPSEAPGSSRRASKTVSEEKDMRKLENRRGFSSLWEEEEEMDGVKCVDRTRYTYKIARLLSGSVSRPGTTPRIRQFPRKKRHESTLIATGLP